MEQQILIPFEHIQYLKPSYLKRIEEIDHLVQLLLKEKTGIQSVLATFDEKPDDVSYTEKSNIDIPARNPHRSYPKKGTWFDKALYVLRQANVPLSTGEAVNLMIKLEPTIKRNSAVAVISSILGSKSKVGLVKKYTIDGVNQKFGLPEWFEGDTLIEEYLQKIKAGIEPAL